MEDWNNKEFVLNKVINDAHNLKYASDDLKMNNFQYKKGINIDTIPFCIDNNCCPGGLYFTTDKYINKFDDDKYGSNIWIVKVPDDAIVFMEGPHKMKADKLELVEQIEH